MVTGRASVRAPAAAPDADDAAETAARSCSTAAAAAEAPAEAGVVQQLAAPESARAVAMASPAADASVAGVVGTTPEWVAPRGPAASSCKPWRVAARR